MMVRALVALALLVTPVRAAFETSRSVAPSSAAYDPLAPCALFWLANPATLSLARNGFTSAYARPFHLRDLETGIATANSSRRNLSLAVGVVTLGHPSLYSETDFALASSLRIHRALSAGATLHYLDLRFGNRFSPWRAAAVDFGTWYEFSRGIGTGISVGDLMLIRPSRRTILDPVFRAALSYRYSPPLGLRAAVEYRTRWVVTLGETLLVTDNLHLHADLLTAPLRVRAGIRLRLGRLYLDYTHRDHPDLGGDDLFLLGVNF